MPVQFINKAKRQLAPAYAKQTNALKAQIPAIQQLYQTLTQGLEGQRQQGYQQINEGANARGLLMSTIPVDQQAQFGQQIAQQGQQYGFDMAQQIGGINSQIAGIGVDKANAISNLANTLYGQYSQNRQASQSRQLQRQQFNLQRQLADRQYQLDQQALQGGYY